MLRIFVTGDNHIGLKYASHPRAEALARERVHAFAGMVDAANSQGCGLFVITGDLFENTYGAAKKDVKAVLDLLAGFHGLVAVLPGNHDYYDRDARLWQYFADVAGDKDNILLLQEYRPYELEVDGQAVVLYPAGCTSLHSAPGENNLGWIKAQNIAADGRYHIGIAHGALQGETIDTEGQYFLMTRQELESIPVDVWLLGHTHVPFPRELTDEYAAAGRIFNAGTHVQTDVACNTAGRCMVVELAGDKSVRARKIDSGALRFYRIPLELSAGEMDARLDRALAPIGSSSVVELVLSGAVTGQEYESRRQLLEDKLARFIEGSYSDSALSKLISKELIDAEFAETSFSAGLLTALLDTPKQAQLVYELLRELKEGK